MEGAKRTWRLSYAVTEITKANRACSPPCPPQSYVLFLRRMLRLRMIIFEELGAAVIFVPDRLQHTCLSIFSRQ